MDALTYVVVVAGLLTASVLASWLPARRASRLDPAQTLRAE
jgi:ABC-type lipoprotein release transport system permease subunit